MRANKTYFGLLLAFLILSKVSALSVGTAPGIYDLGEIEPGKNVAFRFYLITNARNDILVTLGYIPVHQDIYMRTETERYTFVHTEASQEDISSWVEIPRNPLLLSPGRTQVVYLSTGGAVKANEEADIILRVPENADPGYHAGSISLSPKLASAGRGTGVTTIAVTRFVFVFRVAGEAKREGKIQTMIGDRLEAKKARIDVLFKNTGTCTMNARVSELKLFDKFGKQVATLSSGTSVVRPGLINTLPVFWSSEAVQPGTYRAEAKVDYITGFDVMEETIEIPDTISVRPTPIPIPSLEAGSICDQIPNLLLLLIVAALAVYVFDFKSKGLVLTAVAALFVLALLFFVLACSGLFAGLSLMDVFFLIIIIALIVYWRIS